MKVTVDCNEISKLMALVKAFAKPPTVGGGETTGIDVSKVTEGLSGELRLNKSVVLESGEKVDLRLDVELKDGA